MIMNRSGRKEADDPAGQNGAVEPDTNGTETSENEQVKTFSPFDPEVEAPINAAVHFDDQETEEA
jgi:hypothetical protein